MEEEEEDDAADDAAASAEEEDSRDDDMIILIAGVPADDGWAVLVGVIVGEDLPAMGDGGRWEKYRVFNPVFISLSCYLNDDV